MIGDVFLVDDNPANVRLLAEILKKAGHRVRASVSARHALETIRTHPPEVLLLDVSMPEMDGFQLCGALKDEPSTRGIPVLFLSAHDAPAERVRAFAAGGADYVMKPFEAEEIVARVASLLRLTRLEKEAAALREEVRRLSEELRTARGVAPAS